MPIMPIMPIMSTMLTVVVLWTNTRHPWALVVTNVIVCSGPSIVSPNAKNQNRPEQGDCPDKGQLERFLGGAVRIGSHQVRGRDEI
jgi:hypothetical protein